LQRDSTNVAEATLFF